MWPAMARKGLLSRILSGSQGHAEEQPAHKPAPTLKEEIPQHSAEISYSARIAVYDSFTASPFIVDIGSDDFLRIVDEISAKAYNLGRERGGRIPYIVIREVVENLVHAGFKDVVISVEPDGNVIRISDHGPGIADKQRAFTPGFTTATSDLKKFIKGVGSGLPIVKESLELMGGCVILEDNLSSGLVITLKGKLDGKALITPASPQDEPSNGALSEKDEKVDEIINGMSDKDIDENLSARQKKVLMLIAENETAGPSVVAKEMHISAATAYRDLEALEALGLISSSDGKRTITARGTSYATHITRNRPSS